MSRMAWEMGNPETVYARRQGMQQARERSNPFALAMSESDSDQVEDLLSIWYRWTLRYKVNLGAPRVSIYGKGAESSDVYIDADEMDSRIEADKAEQIDACIDSLIWEQRSAIDIRAASKASGNQVLRNPRMTQAQHITAYRDAKLLLLPMLKKRGMIREIK